MRPARGIVLLKPIETAETMPGGLVVLPERVREGWAANQYEVVAVGEPQLCEDFDNCDQPHNARWLIGDTTEPSERWHITDPRLTAGAWVYVQPRSLIEAPGEEKRFFCRADDVMGVFRG